MVNYNNAKIYKIIDNTTGNVYVGSTTQATLAKRLSAHVSNYKRYLNGKFSYVTSFEILKNGDYSIILLEKCEGITCRDELHARERFYIETHKNGECVCVNKYIPNRSIKEYKEDNHDLILQYQKEYYEANKDKIIQYQKEHYEVNRDIILQQNKKYSEANKDKIIQYQKAYRESNRDIILTKKKEKYEANKDKILQKQKIYNEVNRDIISQKKKERYEANKDKIKA